MTKMLGVLALTAAAGAAPLATHVTPGPFYVLQVAHRLHREVKALGITEAQKERIHAVARSHREELTAASDRAWEARMAVAEAVHADTVDEGLIRERVDRAAAAAADAAVLRARVHQEVRAILTPAQREGADRIRAEAWEAIGELRHAFKDFLREAA